MKVLVIAAVDRDDSVVVDALDRVVQTLCRDHDVTTIDLVGEEFDSRMGEAERRAYETDDPIVDPEIGRHAELVTGADAIVFVYRTHWMGLPAALKGWLDRVLVMGVAFELHPRTRKVRPALQNIRRIGVVTVNERRRVESLVLNDAGRRTLGRTFRLICHPLARRTFVVENAAPPRAIKAEAFTAKLDARIERRFGAW